MIERTPFVGGNWKMNTRRDSAAELTRSVVRLCGAYTKHTDIAVFPPYPYLADVAETIADAPILLGAQDVSEMDDGALTGEVSAGMLLDIGCDAALIGHSERRHVIGEPEQLVRSKLHVTLDAGLWAVLCIGETLQQREAGQTDAVNEAQLRSSLEGVDVEQAERQIVVAYEPVWAIGTGRTASAEDAQAAHSAIRRVLADVLSPSSADVIRLIYGGSVKAENAAVLFEQPDVDGFLVGGASLDAREFAAIVAATTH